MKRIFSIIVIVLILIAIVSPNTASAKTKTQAKKAITKTQQQVKVKTTPVPKQEELTINSQPEPDPNIRIVNGQRIETFGDGSQLNLDTNQIVIKTVGNPNPVTIKSEQTLQKDIDAKTAAPYYDAVGLVFCQVSGGYSWGSGWLTKNKDTKQDLVFTNLHVIDGGSDCTFQVKSETHTVVSSASTLPTSDISIFTSTKRTMEMPSAVYAGNNTWYSTDTPKGLAVWLELSKPKKQNYQAEIVSDSKTAQYAVFELNTAIPIQWNQSDFVALTIGKQLRGTMPTSFLNFNLSNTRHCSPLMSVGTKVVVIGYPSYSTNDVADGDGNALGIQAQRQVTEGSITGYDLTIFKNSGKPSPNYFVSAKIDSGNSGGLALSNDDQGICILGIPTWSNPGKFERQGVVQNIANIDYKP
ncbi:trypsin-like peptidase domain-containing protein [Candidatus Uhrbacteria bacterium]|nr:trypsin-like peptidase domain-containing protein [Candidatus Uhrbacteria bacterium]